MKFSQQGAQRLLRWSSLGIALVAVSATSALDSRSQADPPAPARSGFEESIRQKALELEFERERSRQQDAALAIREKVIDLESQRRRVAAYELEQLRHKRETLEARIDYARRSVLQSFDVYDRGLIPNRPSTAKRKRNGKEIEGSFERSKRLREQMLYRLLEFRGQSGGLIASGDALNFFLELSGPSAFAHTFYRTTKAASNSHDDPDEAFLSRITDQYLLPPEVLRHIRYQRGLSGPKLSGRLNQDPLDVNWPAILKRSLSKRTADIERRREEVLSQLRANRAVSPEAADGLLDAVRDLLTAMHEEEASLMQEIRRHGTNSRAQGDWLRYHAAEDHVRILLAGAFRLIEARGIADVSLPPLDDKKGVTVEKLLTYMHENNLRFSPSDSNGQTAYHSIYELMSRYYIDLRSLKLETAKNEQRVAALRVEEAQVKEVMLGNRLDNIQQTEIEVARFKAMAAMSSALLGAIRAGGS
jgi:hypothetical protein